MSSECELRVATCAGTRVLANNKSRVRVNPHSQKQRNKALTLAHAQTIHYTSNWATPWGGLLSRVRAKRAFRHAGLSIALKRKRVKG